MNSVDALTKKSEPYSSLPNWSNLPMDLLITISNKIEDIADFSRFRSVCKPWNLASKKSTLKSPQVPWLLLPYDSKTTNRSFINPLSEAIYKFDIPEARDHAIIGSSNGWLVLIDKDFSLTILNPVTHAQVDQYIPQLTYFRAVTKVNRRQGLSFIAKSLRCYVHISPNYPESLSDCVLAFSVENYKHVLFCNIGDTSWNTIRCLSRNICSLAYHKGKFYVVCEGSGLIGVSNANSDSMVVKDAGIKHGCFSYFVKRENELLLLVDRTRDDDYDYDDCLEFPDYEVFKLKDCDNCGAMRDSSDDNDSSSSGGSDHTSHSDTEYEDDSDVNSYYSDSDDAGGDCVGSRYTNYCRASSNCGSDDNDYDEGYADYRIGDFDEVDIEESDDTWLEYNAQGDYTIFFTAGVVSTIFSSDPSCFEGKSVCYPSNKAIVGYLDGIELCDLDDQTEETVADLGDQRFCPYELNPIWLAPSLH